MQKENTIMKRIAALFGVLELTAFSAVSQAQTVPQNLSFQGRLAEPDGTPVPDNAAQAVTFRLFSAASGGAALWSQTAGAAVHNGAFSAKPDFSVSASYAAGQRFSSLFSGTPLYLEIQVGTDASLTPRQPLASNAYAFLSNTALNVAPGSVTLNSLASGVLNFSNLNGTVSGSQIAAGSISVSNLSVGLQGTLSYFSSGVSAPVLKSTTATGNAPFGVAVSGNTAYVTNFQGQSLQIFDITSHAAPVLRSTTGTNGQCEGAAVVGNFVYLVNTSSGNLKIYDVSNPAAPVLKSSTLTGGSPRRLNVVGNIAYLFNEGAQNRGTINPQGFQTFDVSNPAAPVLLASATTAGVALSGTVSGAYAYALSADANTMQIFDISVPAAPVLKSSIGTGVFPLSVAVSGSIACVANSGTYDGATVSNSSLQIFNISDPAHPVLLSTTPIASGAYALAQVGSTVYMCSYFNSVMQIFDVSNPAAPVLTSSLTPGTNPGFVAAVGGSVFVCNAGSNTLQIFDAPAFLQINGNLAVTGTATFSGAVKSLSGGFLFPDGTAQTTAAVPFALPYTGTGSLTNSGLFSITNNGATGAGIVGNGQSIGLWGLSSAPGGSGVVGFDTVGGGYGVRGNSASGIGVYGNSSNGNGVYGNSSGGNAGYFAGNVVYTGTLTHSSDARYKTHVAPLENALDDVLNLRGVSYEFDRARWPEMNFPNGRQIGFIAQELEKVLPELTRTDKNGYKSVMYQDLTPVLVEAVKTLKGHLDEKQKQIDGLQAQVREIAALKKRVADMEALQADLTALAKELKKAQPERK